VIAVIAAAVVLLFIILTTPVGERYLKGILESKISGYLQLPVSIDRLDTNLLSRLRLHGTLISNPRPGEDNAALLSIEDIDCRYNLWRLPFKDITIESINITNVMVHARRDSLGKFGITILDSIMAAGESPVNKEDTGSTYNIRLGKFELQGFSAEYSDDSLALHSYLDNLNIRLEEIEVSKYDITLSADSFRVFYDSIPLTIKSISLAGNLSDRDMRIKSLSSSIDNLDLTGQGIIPFDTLESIYADLTLSGNPGTIVDKIVTRFGISKPEIADGFSMTAHVTGAMASPDISADMVIPSIKIDQIVIDNGALSMRRLGDSLYLDSMRLRLFGGNIGISGMAALDTIPGVQFRLQFEQFDIPGMWSSIYGEETSNTGILSGVAEIAGEGYNIENWKIKSDFRATRLAYEGKNLPEMIGTISLSGGDALINIGDSNIGIAARGRIRGEMLSGNFEASISDVSPLAALFNITELDGSIFCRGNIAGTTEFPKATADIYLSRMHYRNFPLDSLDAHVEYIDSVLHIREMHFSGKLDSIDPASPPFEIDSLSGSVDYGGTMSGTIDSLVGTVKFNLRQAGYGEYKLDSTNLNVDVNGRDIYLTEGHLYKDSLAVISSGKINIDNLRGIFKAGLLDNSTVVDSNARTAGLIEAVFDISDTAKMVVDISGHDLRLSLIDYFYPSTFDLRGTVDFTLDFKGNIENPEVQLSATVTEPEFNNVALDSIIVHTDLQGNLFKLSSFNAYGFQQSMTGNALISLMRDSTGYTIDSKSRTSGAVGMNNFDLSLLEPFMSEGSGLAGTSSLDLKWDGSIADPNLTGWLELQNGYYRQTANSVPVENVHIIAAVRDTILSIEKSGGTILAKDFTVDGSMILSQSKEARTDIVVSFADFGKLSVKGKLSADSIGLTILTDSTDIALLRPFFTDIREIGGVLKAELMIKGQIDDPDIMGQVDISRILLWPSELPVPFKDGFIHARFDKDKVFIDTLAMVLNKGRILANGNLTHDMGEITDINMRLSLDSILIDSPDEYIINIRSGRFTYRRDGEYFLFDGDMEFGESRLTANLRPQSILPWAQSVEQTRFELPPILENTRLNVRIRESNELWIDNNLARLKLRTELGIIGSPGLPNFTGRVNAEEGYMLYLDRKFQVKEGTIYFIDPNSFNPEINLTAEATVKSYQAMEATAYLITFSAKGPLRELAVDIISEPTLDKADIIALLTLGATREQLMGKDSDSKGALTERAQMLTSQKISGYISRKIGTVFGLDEVSVQGNLFSMNQSAGPQLLASKKITDRAKLTYSTTVGRSNDQSVRLDYQLTKRFFLEGQTDRLGRSALDLKYKLRFR